MCGSTNNLEFDHINSNDKLFCISKNMSHKYDAIKEELYKCQLLCHNCHMKKTKNFKDSNIVISDDIANKIRVEYATTNITQKELGIKYGVKENTISAIVRGSRWKNEMAKLLCGAKLLTIAIDMIEINSGNIIKSYNSISDAVKDGHTSASISRCINGKCKTHHGYVWKKHVVQLE